jgi:hypothetical protein
MSHDELPSKAIALYSFALGLLLSCVLLGGCARQAVEKKGATAAAERQLSQAPDEFPKHPSQPKPVVYHKGATVEAGIKGARMTFVAHGGQLDLMDENAPMVYLGRIAAVLPDGSEVDADCPLKILRGLRGYSDVTAGKRSEDGLALEATFVAKEQKANPQQVVLLYDGQKWRVRNIVK